MKTLAVQTNLFWHNGNQPMGGGILVTWNRNYTSPTAIGSTQLLATTEIDVVPLPSPGLTCCPYPTLKYERSLWGNWVLPGTILVANAQLPNVICVVAVGAQLNHLPFWLLRRSWVRGAGGC